MKWFPWLMMTCTAAGFFLAGMAWRPTPESGPQTGAETSAVSEPKGVTGVGGVFFKARDPKGLIAWYQQHLGLKPTSGSSVLFNWREADSPERFGQTVWGVFPETTEYFDPSTAPFMINFRVADLDGLLKRLRAAGVQVDDRLEEYDYGRFGWIMDPEGNRIELWEPADILPK